MSEYIDTLVERLKPHLRKPGSAEVRAILERAEREEAASEPMCSVDDLVEWFDVFGRDCNARQIAAASVVAFFLLLDYDNIEIEREGAAIVYALRSDHVVLELSVAEDGALRQHKVRGEDHDVEPCTWEDLGEAVQWFVNAAP